MNTYQEKKQSQIIRYKQMSEKLESQAEALISRMNAMEGKKFSPKRADIEKQRRERNIDRAEMLLRKADDYKRLATSIENSSAISSDDPDAITKHTQRINELNHDLWKLKELNRIAKDKNLRLDQKLVQLHDLMPTEDFVHFFHHEKNFDNRIAKVSKAIKHSQSQVQKILESRSIPESYEVINDVALQVDQQLNRIRLIFPGIPDERIRKALKAAGFVWMPSKGSWVRKISKAGIEAGKQVLEGLRQ